MKNYYGIIYCATNKITSHKYIGKTKYSLKDRKRMHENFNIKKLLYFQKILLEYGKDNFEWSILDYGYSKEDLENKEIYWIKTYHTFCCDPDFNGGYNKTSGGNKANTMEIFSEEAKKEIRKKISRSLFETNENKRKNGILPYARHDNRNPMYGKEHSFNTKEKIIKAVKNYWKSRDRNSKEYLEYMKKRLKSIGNKLANGNNPMAIQVQCIETNEIFETASLGAEKMYGNKKFYRNIMYSTKNGNKTKGYTWRIHNEKET
jgi:group I intron endonuclease